MRKQIVSMLLAAVALALAVPAFASTSSAIKGTDLQPAATIQALDSKNLTDTGGDMATLHEVIRFGTAPAFAQTASFKDASGSGILANKTCISPISFTTAAIDTTGLKSTVMALTTGNDNFSATSAPAFAKMEDSGVIRLGTAQAMAFATALSSTTTNIIAKTTTPPTNREPKTEVVALRTFEASIVTTGADASLSG